MAAQTLQDAPDLQATPKPSPLRVAEQLRIEAVRRLVQDQELEDIERELRRDLKNMGHSLQWDHTRRELQKTLPEAPVGIERRPAVEMASRKLFDDSNVFHPGLKEHEEISQHVAASLQRREELLNAAANSSAPNADESSRPSELASPK